MAGSKRQQLFGLMQNQEAQRTRDRFFRMHDTKELRACSRLAHQLFGARGLVEVNPGEPGVLYIARYDRVYPPSVPGARRKRQLILRGRSYADLLAQAKVLNA